MSNFLTKTIGSIAQNTKKLHEKILQDAQDHFQKWDPSEKYGPLWEASETVLHCRECRSDFQMPFVRRKYHCRLCAGVYCDSCCELSELTDTFQSADNEPVRACGGCKRGEAPGQSIKDFIRKKLESAEKKEKAADASAMEKIQKRVVAAIGDNLGVKFSCRPPSVAVLLSHGRRYSSEDEVLSDGSELPISGYFEFTNKSDVFCCLKVLLTGGDKKFEIPRPSYCAVPPGGSVHGSFDPEVPMIDILLLFANPHEIPTGKRINYETRQSAGKKPLRISPCAKIDEFRNVAVFTAKCKHYNVMLKYKGDDIVVPRIGNSISRVGFLNWIRGHRYAANIIDYSTNVNGVNLKFTYST